MPARDPFPPLAALVAVLALIAVPAGAQVPLGAEFRANTYTPAAQVFPWAALAADGSAVVVWMDRGTFVVSRAYDPTGAPRGGELPVNLPGGSIFRPAVTARPGGFVVAWMDTSITGGVAGRLLDPPGNPLGSPFRVNTSAASATLWARAAADSAGR